MRESSLGPPGTPSAETRYVKYNRRILPKAVALTALGQKGKVDAPHRDGKVERRKHLWQKLQDAKKTLVRLGKEIVAVV